MADSKKVVCVTGASGFIGAHVVRALLERGYSVRGTVRDANNETRCSWIRELAKGTPGSLELFTADLMNFGSFDAAVEGCEFVVHAAASVKLKAKDPQRDIVDPCVEGTRNVLSSILKAKCAKRVVVTSSIAAVAGYPPIKDHVYTEADWNESVTAKDPYHLGKTLSEKLVWKAYEEQPEDGWRFELVTMLPGYVAGPVFNKQHLGTTPQIVQQLLNGFFPLAPNFNVPVVDVRDVALAHVAALEDSRAKGRYLLVSKDVFHMLQVAEILRQEYPDAWLPRYPMPNFLIYAASLVHPALSWDSLRLMLNGPIYYSGEKIRKELDFEFRPADRALLDTAKSFVDLNLLTARP